MRTLFVPEGTGPYNVDGAEYPVTDGTIECNNRDHVPMLMALGASESPIAAPVVSEAAPVGSRVQSDFGPSQAEHDSLRASRDALAEENEAILADLKTRDDDVARLADVIIETDLPLAADEGAIDCAIRHLRAYAALPAPASDADADEAAPGTDTADKGEGASGGTSSGADDATKLADPGFTEDSDYQEILAWLKTNEVEHKHNISKVDAIAAVTAKLAEANKE